MTTERIDIQVREDGSRVVRRNLEGLDPAARKAATGIDFLKKALAALGGALVARELLAMVNTFQNLENRLRSTGLEGAALTAVYRELLKASNDTRSSVEGSVELYARLALSSKELGVSQRQLIDFTKSLNQAIILSGASAQEAQAGLIQLSQGMASGTLRGDELRSVLEQLPAVADIIAKRMGVTRGELRKMGEDGKITAGIILDAFKASRLELEERFGRVVPTLGQSFQVLKNRVLDYVGQTDKALGVSAALGKLLKGVADNLDTVARAAVGLAAGLVLVAGGAAAVRGLAVAVQALTAAMAANPVGAFLVVLTSALTTLYLFRDAIDVGIEGGSTLGDVFRAVGDLIVPALRELGKVASEVFGTVGDYVRGLTKDVDLSFVSIARIVAKGLDKFVGFWIGAVGAVLAVFGNLPGAIGDLFIRGLNKAIEAVNGFANKIIDILNPLLTKAGFGAIDPVALFEPLKNEFEGEAAKLGKATADAFALGLETNTAQRAVEALIAHTKQITAARQEAERLAARGQPGVSDKAGTARVAPVDPKEVLKAESALRQLLNAIKPSEGAVLELAKAERVLDEAVKVGVISREKANAYLALTRKYYEDAINPLRAYMRGLEEQVQLLRVTAHEREVEAEVLRATQDFQRQGIPLTQQETEQLRAKLQALRDLNAATQAQDAILASTIGKRREFATQLQALADLASTGQLKGGDKATAINNVLSSAGIDTTGTQAAADAYVAQFEQMYMQIAALREKNLISEQDANMLIARARVEQQNMSLQHTQTFFGSLATLSKSGNKKLANIGKAAAVAQATIDGILAVQKALAAAPPPVNYALAAAVGVAAAANVAAIMKNGYENGGYTGNLGKKEVAGVVHGREFVVNADATARNRAALEAMNRGATPAGMNMGGSVVKVTVNNNAGGTEASVNERQGPDGPEIEVVIEQVAARSIRRGGAMATALEAQYGLNRAAGAAR